MRVVSGTSMRALTLLNSGAGCVGLDGMRGSDVLCVLGVILERRFVS